MKDWQEIKVSINPWNEQEAREIASMYPNILNIEHTNPKKKVLKESYTQTVKLLPNIVEKMIEEIWVTNYWYLCLLQQGMLFDNKVDFQYLLDRWVSKRTVWNIRPLFLKNNLIAKHGNYYYMNPYLFRKWSYMEPKVVDIFERKPMFNK